MANVQPKEFTQTPCDKKRYYARVAGSRFCHEDGTETIFAYGFADIAILEHQREIDKVLGKNPNIYIPEVLPIKEPAVPQNALSEVELANEEAKQSKVKGHTAQELGTSDTGGVPSDPNASTVDPEIRDAVFKTAPRVVGPGASNAVKPIPASAAVSLAATNSVSK